MLSAEGLNALHCNGSVFLSTDIFHPITDGPKKYDAIYDAVTSPYKRHHLAQNINSLALITYTKGDSSQAYIRSTIETLSHAEWLNGSPAQETVSFDAREVNRCINKAHAGLCLSAREGFMYASAQYLLAGIPVVSTRSKGGRDVFYDPAFVKTVDDNPNAILEAVQELCEAQISSEFIRDFTLERFRPFRNRFVSLMQGILDGEWRPDTWKNGWPENLPNKLEGSAFTLQENLAALESPGQTPPWQQSENRYHAN
jgi:glycosyltransferase involved in cell wall biosynthesis